ncbi:MAG TPA: NAD(P)-binding domain-containing protein [Anaerolineaceae bacterium]|nr:NAD(P)-binding domain-containing protein [Anaerolineaceae bacterium]
MKIAVIGAGNIGATLGKKWAKADHSVYYGVREPGHGKYSHLHASGQVVSIEDALDPARVVLLAIPGDAVTQFIEEHTDLINNKLIIDATNNIHGGPMNNLEVLYKNTGNTQLVRAFSTLGWENFENPVVNGQQVDLFYCGHSGARPIVEKLIMDVGLRPVYLGPLEKAELVDGLTKVWFELVFEQGHKRRLMFKMVEEES